jgi:hypothetical protein
MLIYAEISSAASRRLPSTISNGIRRFQKSWNKLKARFLIRSKPPNKHPEELI